MAIDIPHAAGGSYPLRAGNAVRPWVDGVPAFRRIGEAIEAARRSLWLTVAFFRPDFRMPDSRQSLFEVLDRAAARGLDVRVIFWRPNPEFSGEGGTFSGITHSWLPITRRALSPALRTATSFGSETIADKMAAGQPRYFLCRARQRFSNRISRYSPPDFSIS